MKAFFKTAFLPGLMVIFLLLSFSCRVDPLADIDLEDMDALGARGFELIRKERFEDAMNVFEYATEKFPEEAILFNGYGIAAERANRISLAVHKFRQACWIEPFNETFRNNFVRVYEKQQSRHSKDPGFTDYAIGGPQLGHLERVRGTVTGVEQQMFQRAVELFKMHNNRLPENLQELVQNGIISRQELIDPFGRPYWSYRENNTFVIRSSGQDMVMFTNYDQIIQIR